MAHIKRALQNRSTPPADDDEVIEDPAYRARRIVGARVRRERLRKGFTQAEVAKQLGVFHTAISAIEIGRNSVPPERYKELGDLLGINRREWGKFLLRETDPWIYELIYGEDEALREKLKRIPERVGDTRKD